MIVKTIKKVISIPQDVVFPSITICNLNQVAASDLKLLNVYGNNTRTNIVMNEFIKGHQGNLSKSDEDFVNEIKETFDIGKGWSFLRKSMQWCRNLFTSISFRGRKLTWNQLPPSEILGPSTFLTDFGSCCLLVPHLQLSSYSDFETTKDDYFKKVPQFESRYPKWGR